MYAYFTYMCTNSKYESFYTNPKPLIKMSASLRGMGSVRRVRGWEGKNTQTFKKQLEDKTL